MPRINLPDGQWADLRNPADLRRKDVKAALRLADAQGINLMDGQFGLSGIGAIQEGLLVQFITDWSLTNGDGQTPLPVSVDSLGELPVSTFNRLAAEIAPALQEVMGGEAPPVDPTSAAVSSMPPPTG